MNAGEARNKIARAITFLCAMVGVLATVGIVVVLGKDSFGFFQRVPVGDFLFGTVWRPDASVPMYGVLPLICGTMLVVATSAFVSIPLGLLVGVYLAEYARPKVAGVLKPALELLAGIPSVVFGYFALYLVTPLIQKIIPTAAGSNALSAGIVVGLMTLPFVASLCEDAITSVPKGLRESAFGLGSTKAEVVTKIVVPSALSGVIASFILATSRAVGEVMAVTIAAGSRPVLTANPTEEVQTMTAYIVQVSRGEASRGSMQYQTIFAVGLTLFAITFAMNIFARQLIRKYARGSGS